MPSPRTLTNAVCVRVLQVLFNFAAGEFTPGTEYTFVAYASNAVGEGPPSKPATFTPRVPGPPSIDAVALVSGSLSLDVSPPTDPGSSTTTTTLLNPHSSHKVTSGPGKPGAGENDKKEEESVRPGAIGAPSLVAVWIVAPSGKMNWQGRREGKGKKEKGRKD